jgi:hypothetical protein
MGRRCIDWAEKDVVSAGYRRGLDIKRGRLGTHVM